ncbi:MAG TPA: DUF721 domain-containing protein [Gemmatimonadales bacterium]
MKETKGPLPIGDVLGTWIARHGMARRFDLVNAVEAWPDAVGPQIAAVTRAISVAPDGTLMVRVTTHSWATELGLMAPRILARLNGSKRGRVLHIRWLVGPLDRP